MIKIALTFGLVIAFAAWQIYSLRPRADEREDD